MRGVAAYVWVVAGLNALLWLANVVPALDDAAPTPMLDGTGVTTNAIYVQDLAVWLPLMVVAAGWLSRREARGAVVVLAGLVLWVVEAVSIAVDQAFGAAADPELDGGLHGPGGAVPRPGRGGAGARVGAPAPCRHRGSRPGTASFPGTTTTRRSLHRAS